VKLYEYGMTRSARAHWVLREAGIGYEPVTVDLPGGEHKKPEFLAINPYGKLPVLVDGDGTVTESAAICTYIAEKYADGRLIPANGTIERAHYHQWICFCIAEMEPQLWSIRKNMLLYPREQRSHKAIKTARTEYDKAVRILAVHLADKIHVLKDTFSAADIVVCYNLIWADSLGLLAACPELVAYMHRMMQRPAFPSFLFPDQTNEEG